MNKTLKVMTSAALLAGVVAPVAVTTVDAANSKNFVDKVLYVSDDYKAEGENILTIRPDDVKITSTTTGDTFRLSLPTDVEWLDTYYEEGKALKGDSNLFVVSRTDRDLELRIDKAPTKGDSGKEQYEIPLYFEVDGAEGDIKVTIDPRGSVISGGQYSIAVAGADNAVVSISEVKTIKDNGTIDVIRIDETSLGAIYSDGDYTSTKQEITLTLPADFDWGKGISKSNIVLGGGFAEAGVITNLEATPKDNKLTVTFNVAKKPSKLGTFYIKDLVIDADKDADFGEIEVDVDGDEVASNTIVVAKYGDFGTDAELEGEVPTLLAGRLTDDDKDIETVEVLVKETVAGSWLPGRSVDVEFPTWVKVLGVDVSDAKYFDLVKADGSTVSLGDNDVADLFNDDIEGDSNEISFDLPNLKDTTKKREFKVKFYVSTKADAEGDVTVKIDGRAGIQVEETVVAKVVAPVTIETSKVDVRTGIKEQPLNDIVLTEAVKGALLEDKEVELTLSNGEFTDNEPTITVEDGNVKIDEDSIDVDGNTLKFTIDGESTRASKIKISGLSLDLSRSVPEGDVTVEVGGDAILQNAQDDSGYAVETAKLTQIGDKSGVKSDKELDFTAKMGPGEFDRDYVAKVAVATVVTPAEGNVSAETVTLTIGSGTMKVGDKEVAIDAAPYIEASTGRTYLPLRAIANAVGANSVEWDNASRTATVIKNGLVAQMTIGQNSYVLNGAKIGMDGKAQITSERTFLPVRALGNALGATVEWDAATQTVTIK